MKAYTNEEQSKKLAEFLPIETADMFWKNGLSNKHFQCFTPYFNTGTDMDYDYDLPCWSLAALLNIIPPVIEIEGQKYAPCLFPIVNGQWLYKLWYNSNYTIDSPIAVWCDTPVDAGYEMILKLHENKML